VTLADDLGIQGHIIVPLPIPTTAHARTPNLIFILMFYESDNSFRGHIISSVTAKCVTLKDNLEIQGLVILHVTLLISTTAHARTPNLFLLMFYVSDNSFRVLPNA